uniref:Endo-1,3(4)-beta-glucanase 1 carbohydrate binding domain-containing protein n=1 Tax=Mycena chlorophos TaxID=658473 RepID=A0ABQ0LWX0_MYCCL|nr:predicted protein [Mycena chlorophos]
MFNILHIQAAIIAMTVASPFVHAQLNLTCGGVPYNHTEASCFDDTTLCPFEDGLRFLPCAGICYNPELKACTNNTILGFEGERPEFYICGPTALYDPALVSPVFGNFTATILSLDSKYSCFDGNLLCPKTETVPSLPCGEACYDPSEYICNGTTLILNPGPPDCFPLNAVNVWCDWENCFTLDCCPGLSSGLDGDTCQPE